MVWYNINYTDTEVKCVNFYTIIKVLDHHVV